MQKNKIKYVTVFFLLSCILFSACSAKSNTSASIKEQKPSTQLKEAAVEKSEKVIETVDENDVFKPQLLYALSERDIYLYSNVDGVTLNVGDTHHDFNWPYMTPRGISPRMQVSDFDSDGKDELLVILYVGSGTGVSVEELHIVEISEDKTLSGKQLGSPNPEYFKDHMFSNYTSQLDTDIGFRTFNKAGELMVNITTHTKTYTVSLKNFQSKDYGKIDDKICFGNIVRFNTENNKIMAEFGVGITSQYNPDPFYIGSIDAEVEYNTGTFKMKNFHFSESTE